MLFDNDFVFLQGDTYIELGYPIWIGLISPNTTCDQFNKLCVYDKHIDLYGIRIDTGYIFLTIQAYEHIPRIYGSDLVYKLYFDNPPQVKSILNLCMEIYQ